MNLPAAGLGLAIATSLGWAGLDLTRKYLVGKMSSLALLFWLTLGSLPFFAAWYWLQGGSSLREGYWPAAIASILLNVVANLCFFESFKRAPLSLTIPLLSLTPVFATLFAIPLLSEVPSAWRWLGIVLVVAGAVMLHSSATRANGGEGGYRRYLSGTLLMTATALMWAATISFDKRAMEASNEPTHGLILLSGVAASTLLVLAFRRQLSAVAEVRRAPAVLAVALAVGSFALGTQLAALKLVSVSVVETLKRAVGNASAVAAGAVLFGESINPRGILAVVLMAAGAALVMLAR